MTSQPETGRWAVLLMDGSPAPSIHRAWHIDGDEATAEAFRAFVSDEIDPAIKIRLRSPLDELLSWRTAVAVDGPCRVNAQHRADECDGFHLSENDS